MTEEEAKTKICHRSIDGSDSPATVISNEMFARKFACVGSKCMAWQWIGDAKYSDIVKQFMAYDKSNTLRAAHGFCGLAGKP